MKQPDDYTPPDESRAFEAVLSRYKGLLFRLSSRFSSREATVEDLMQEIALALWNQREKLWQVPDGVQRAAWIWRVGRNAAIDCLRRTPGHVPIETGVEETLLEEDTSLTDSLHEQIATLGEPDSSLVRLQLQGYSYEEIAAQMQMSVKNVSVRLVRLKEKLRKLMT